MAIDTEPNPKNKQEKLSEDLLNKIISSNEFIEALFQLDQSRDDRQEALNNVKVIEDPKIQDVILQNPDADCEEFFNFASLTHLHIFQILIGDAEQELVALRHLNKANEYAQKIDNEGYEDWKNYIAALVAYTKGDLGTLRNVCDKIPNEDIEVDGSYKMIVLHLIKKLEQNGKPVYN